jgi:hypothetical protein
MAKAQWTVLTYIAAHNNLALLGKQSLMQILKVGSTEQVVHGVLYDGPDGGGRYLMGEPGTVSEQEQFDEFDGGDPKALIDTATWLFKKCPAERYGLVLWSHGNGWTPDEITQVAAEARPAATADADEPLERAGTPGAMALFRTTLQALQQPPSRRERAILFDDGSGHSLDTLELHRVTRTIADAVGRPLELLGMDACLMASVEVAYQLRDSVRVVVASPEFVPGHSWPYPAIYGALSSHPEQNGTDVGKLVVDEYVRFYTAHPPGAGDVAKVALDLGRIGELGDATRALADALILGIADHAPILWDVQRSSRAHETNGGKRSPNKFEFHLWDLGALASRLAAAPTTSEPVRAAATGVTTSLTPGHAVLAEGHRGAWFDGTNGVSVYLMPPGAQRVSPHYQPLAFAGQTRWLEMLTAYHDQLA